MSVTVAIPALDELDNLRILLPELAGLSESLGNVYLQVLVVVERDPDPEEVSELESMGATVIARAPTNSFGDAIRTAIAEINKDSNFVVFMDADGSHSPRRIPDLLAEMKNADVVVASRYVDGGTSENSLLLRTMSIALNRAYSLVLGLDCRDVSTNYKMYRANMLKQLDLRCANFDIVEEMLFSVSVQVLPERLRITEIPDHFAQRQSGETKRQLGVYIASYIWTLWKLRTMQRRESKFHARK